MRDRESGDRLHQFPAPAYNQRQPKDKNQMVDTSDDMVKAQKQVFCTHGKRAARAFNSHRGRGRPEKLGLVCTIGELDTNQNLGAGIGQAIDRNSPADQASIATI